MVLVAQASACEVFSEGFIAASRVKSKLRLGTVMIFAALKQFRLVNRLILRLGSGQANHKSRLTNHGSSPPLLPFHARSVSRCAAAPEPLPTARAVLRHRARSGEIPPPPATNSPAPASPHAAA